MYSQKIINYSANYTWMTKKRNKNFTRQEMEVLIEEISNNLCLMRICSATVDGNLMKFFTILLRALDTLKTIRLMLDWLILTVLLKTAWNDPEAKKHRSTTICSIMGREEDLLVFRCKLSQNMCKIHYWVSWKPIKSKQNMVRKGERICSVSKRPFWLSLSLLTTHRISIWNTNI